MLFMIILCVFVFLDLYVVKIIIRKSNLGNYRLCLLVVVVFDLRQTTNFDLCRLMVAAKFFEDQPCDNGYFATVGGVSVQEINNMELVFLDMLEYRVSITNFEFNLYASVVEAKADCLDKPRQHYMKEVGLPCFSLLQSVFIHTFSCTGNYTRHYCFVHRIGD